MSLHNFNSNTKSWKMYTNTITSISGDDLLVMPSYGKNLILEVSANNDIFFKKGTITKRFDNLVSDYLDMSFNSLNSQVQYILQEISGNSVKDFITSGISNDLLIKSYDGRDIILEVSGNNEIIFKRGDLSYNLDDLIGGGGGGESSQNSDYATYNILDITGKIIFTDNSNVERNYDASFNNVEINGSLNVAGSISASNIYTKSQVDASFSNIYTKSQVDASFSNVYTKLSVIDSSLVNVYTRGQVDVSFVSKQLFDASLSSIQLSNVYTKSQVDVSFVSMQLFEASYNVLAASSGGGGGGYIQNNENISFDILNITDTIIFTDSSNVELYNDASFNNVDISGSLNVAGTISASSFIGDGSLLTGIQEMTLLNYRDASFSNIEVSGNIQTTHIKSFNSQDLVLEVSGNNEIIFKRGDISYNLDDLIGGGSSQNSDYALYNILDITSEIIFTDNSNSTSSSNSNRSSNIVLTSISENIIPSTDNTFKLGDISKNWSNAYINDISVTNIELSGNIVPLNANSSSLGTGLKSWRNAYIHDISVSSIDVSGALNVMGTVSAPNLYTKSEVDVSFVSKQLFDASLSSIQLTNVYTKSQVDVSFVSKQLFDASLSSIQLTNVYTKSQVDVSFVSKQLFDASINALTASSGGSGGSSTDLTSVTSNVVPSTTNTYNLGSTTKNWNNAYINNLKVSNRVYQEISGDISWSAVNGHYGLMKTSYPSLNSYSSLAKISTWRGVTITNPSISTTYWGRTAWSPSLGLFVCVGSKNTGTTVVMTSNNGINWNPITIDNTNIINSYWELICWSPELNIFVAAAGQWHTPLQFMTSSNGINWTPASYNTAIAVKAIVWSSQLGIFVALLQTNGTNKVLTSTDGSNWTERPLPTSPQNLMNSHAEALCWAPELGLFVAVAVDGVRAMSSKNGINWSSCNVPASCVDVQWQSITWSAQLGIFVSVARGGGPAGSPRLMTSYDGINWTARGLNNERWIDVCWSAELALFVIVTDNDSIPTRVKISPDGINWTFASSGVPLISHSLRNVIWCPELGIFLATGSGNFIITISSLKARPPTSYNVFDSSFNSIDETGKWSFQNLGVTGTFTNTSDDRLKHNEVVINNGLAIIDSLTPKFYQKTLTMLDASYNGDLSGQAWTYEAGVIAQELLQISDLSFVVSGGDYYQERYIYSRPTNDPSNANYDPSLNIYDISNANYTISNTLITQAYNVNYNSVFVYGLAAIKELHQKVKAQETSISTLQTAMLEQQQGVINDMSSNINTLKDEITTLKQNMDSLLTRLQALETSASQ